MRKLVLAAAVFLNFAHTTSVDNTIAFASTRPQKQQSCNDRVRFFAKYSLYFVEADGAFGGTNFAAVDDGNNNITQLSNTNNWDIGHFALIGLQLPKTHFKVFAEGWFFKNTKTRVLSVTPPTTIDVERFNVGFVGNSLTSRFESDHYEANLFISYQAYIKNAFSLTPYVGVRYLNLRDAIDGTITDNVDNATFFDHFKWDGYGTVFAAKVKYMFTNCIYVFTDYRYSILFIRSCEEVFSDSTNQLAFNSYAVKKLELMNELSELMVGLGCIVFDKKCWSLLIEASYKKVKWSNTTFFDYQALGIGIKTTF